jgi:hypothetical protein
MSNTVKLALRQSIPLVLKNKYKLYVIYPKNMAQRIHIIWTRLGYSRSLHRIVLLQLKLGVVERRVRIV